MPSRWAAQGRVDPMIALWAPFLLFAALIVWMYWTLAHKPGGQPIGALERVFAMGRASGSADCSAAAVAPPVPRRMINLHFFPSRRIALYMARLFVARSLAVLAALVVDPDDARSARQFRQDPRRSRQWRRRTVALCRACACRS